ncbi:MAG: S8 family serine peptidase, partial [Bacteroidota bacterium]
MEERNLEPNDPFFQNQWGMDLIQAPGVWEFTTGGLTANGDTIVIGVLDSGFDIDHADLVDNLWTNWAEKNGLAGVDDDQNGYVDDVYGYNFAQNKPEHADGNHGNPVTGILGASGNNEKGVSGVNWSVKVVPMTVFTDFDIIEAYQYVKDLRDLYQNSNGTEGAFVVTTNASLGLSNRFCGEFPLWGAMYDQIGPSGILSVAATTNEDQDVEEVGDMPTTCLSDYLLSVTNSDRDDVKVQRAGFGAESIDLAAPGGPFGDGTYTILTENGYDISFGGTSASCPHVAGAVALLYSLPSQRLADDALNRPGETALLIREAILAGVDELPSLQGQTVTGGRLNVYQSMLYIHSFYQ